VYSRLRADTAGLMLLSARLRYLSCVMRKTLSTKITEKLLETKRISSTQ